MMTLLIVPIYYRYNTVVGDLLKDGVEFKAILGVKRQNCVFAAKNTFYFFVTIGGERGKTQM